MLQHKLSTRKNLKVDSNYGTAFRVDSMTSRSSLQRFDNSPTRLENFSPKFDRNSK